MSNFGGRLRTVGHWEIFVWRAAGPYEIQIFVLGFPRIVGICEG